jgi:serine/threonine protein kinase
MSDPSQELDVIIAQYLQAIESGEVISREELIGRNPRFADVLRAFFANQEDLQQITIHHPHANGPASSPRAEATPGNILNGRYKLIERIGEGGMGTVWVAEQFEPIRRKVAIKLVKAGMDTKQVLARFEAERQALAMMDHPNIAKVFDGGVTESGRPYFVMEYVKGIPFTEYCDRAKLSLKERLLLFVPVCQAVQHAHHKGIVHRDLKPSNILICLYDGKPVPKVIDFGLAKAMHQPLTDKSIYTSHGMMVGTPLYMSPEQAELNNLDVDTRTDVYSLGVVLYELLTGTTPLERQQLHDAAYNEVLRLIKEVEPTRPSIKLSGSASLPSIAAQRSIDPRDLRRTLAGDLDWIVMKSLEKERSRRYETANGLARDIERFLNEEAVEACPPSNIYRLKKLFNKHRGKVIAASLLVGSLILGIVGTSLGLVVARRAHIVSRDSERKANAALVQVGKERDEKETQRANAIKLAADLELKTYRLGLQSAYNDIQIGELNSARETLLQLPEKHRGWEWNWLIAESDKTLSRTQLPIGKEVLAISRDGLSCMLQDESNEQELTVKESVSGRTIATISLPPHKKILSVAIAKDANRCFIAVAKETDPKVGLSSSVFIWDRTARAIISQVDGDLSKDGFIFVSYGLQCSDDGRSFLANIGEDGFSKWMRCVLYRTDRPGKQWFLGTPRWELSPSGDKVTELGGKYKEMRYASNDEYVETKLSTPNSCIKYDGTNSSDRYTIRDGKWYLLDRIESKPITIPGLNLPGSSSDVDNIELYDGGSCAVRIEGAQLQYLDLKSSNGNFLYGSVPQDVRKRSSRILHIDSKERRVLVFTDNEVCVFPLPSSYELRQLLQIQSSAELAPNGEALAYPTVDKDWSYIGTFSTEGMYSDHASLSPSIVVRDPDSMEIRDIIPTGRIRHIHESGIVAQLDDAEQTLEIYRLFDLHRESPARTEKLFTTVPFRSFVESENREYPRALRVNNDGTESLIVVGPNSDVVAFDAPSATPFWKTEGLGNTVQPLMSAGNKTLVLRCDSKILRVDTKEFKYFDTEGIQACAVSPDQTKLAIVNDGEIQVISLPELELLNRWEMPTGGVRSVAWGAAGSRFFLYSESKLTICDSNNGVRLLQVSLIESTIWNRMSHVVPEVDFGVIGGRIVSSKPVREYWAAWTKTWSSEQGAEDTQRAAEELHSIMSDQAIDADDFFHLEETLSRKVAFSTHLTVKQKVVASQILDFMLREAKPIWNNKEMSLDEKIARIRFRPANGTEFDQPRTLGNSTVEALLFRLIERCSETWNTRAWEIVSLVDGSKEEYSFGLSMALKAVERQSDSATWNTLAVAYFRSEKYQEAIEAIEKSRDQLRGEDDYLSNTIFLAMSLFKVGEVSKARELLTAFSNEYSEKSLDAEDQLFLDEAKKLIRQGSE